MLRNVQNCFSQIFPLRDTLFIRLFFFLLVSKSVKTKVICKSWGPCTKKKGGGSCPWVYCNATCLYCRLPQSSVCRYVRIIMPKFLNGNSVIGFVQSELGKTISHNPKIRLFNSYNLCISNVFDGILFQIFFHFPKNYAVPISVLS